MQFVVCFGKILCSIHASSPIFVLLSRMLIFRTVRHRRLETDQDLLRKEEITSLLAMEHHRTLDHSEEMREEVDFVEKAEEDPSMTREDLKEMTSTAITTTRSSLATFLLRAPPEISRRCSERMGALFMLV